MLEATHTGAFEPQIRINPIRLYRYEEPFAKVYLACELIYIAYIFIFIIQLVNELVLLYIYSIGLLIRFRDDGLRKWLTCLWTWIDLTIIIIASIAAVMYVQRYVLTLKL